MLYAHVACCMLHGLCTTSQRLREAFGALRSAAQCNAARMVHGQQPLARLYAQQLLVRREVLDEILKDLPCGAVSKASLIGRDC